jgi:hypothetical protein
MKKGALRAIARLTHINLKQAAMMVRQNPLLGDEIHIEQELVNLEEAIKTYQMAGETLDHYPEMRAQMIHEKRLILKHCIGLVLRMIHGNRLPHPYSEDDTQTATKRLVQLVVSDVHRNGVVIDGELLTAIRPFVSWRMRWSLAEKPWHGLNISLSSLLPHKVVLFR